MRCCRHGTFFPTLGAEQSDLLADELVPAGRFGVKNGQGHYDWSALATWGMYNLIYY